MPLEARICSLCKEKKLCTRENFSPDRRQPDGCQARCKKCCGSVRRQKSGGKTQSERREENRKRWTAPTLVCNKCRVGQPNNENFFYKNPRHPDQPNPVCIRCQKRYARRPETRAKANEVNRNSEAAKKRRAEAIKRWRQRNRLQQKCYERTRSAIRAGKLKRQPCEQCGSEKAEAHHHKGYEPIHWLDVVWLCKSCHVQEHHAA